MAGGEVIYDQVEGVNRMLGLTNPLRRFVAGFAISALVLFFLKPSFAFQGDTARPWKLAGGTATGGIEPTIAHWAAVAGLVGLGFGTIF